MLNESQVGGGDDNAAARARLQIGSIPSWVIQNSFDAEFKSGPAAPLTYLLFDTQIQAESRETFVHHAIRLETMEAVQHQSQWRLQFEPKTQLVTLHSLKIRRGEVEIDQLIMEKARFLQREEGLERFVLHGWFTFLMVLEDVRPGDILEYSYTIETQPVLLPEHCGYFFVLPQGFSVGKYHFAARFNTARHMKWKSSALIPEPIVRLENDTTFWEWSREKCIWLKPEVNTPTWHITYGWIQISDFPDWPAIAAAVSKTWVAEDGDETIAKLAQHIALNAPDLSSRIENAIRLIQDEYRYLSVNLELGGYIPASPAMVARRRFGDCKDLSSLLAKLLKKIGVRARPVLVNTYLKKSVGDFLPTPVLFNHAVVEFEADGETRWIDTTFKEQGGGPFNRVIPDYGRGLPVDEPSPGLIPPPQLSEQSHLYDLRENILLATDGTPSLLAVTICAAGNQADILRQQLKKQGLAEMAEQRLKSAVSRFGTARRIGSLEYRDERPMNRFVLAEVFEVKPILNPHPNPKLCRFQVPNHWLAGILAMPDKSGRQTPFALPYPCQVIYTLDVVSSSMGQIKINDPHSKLSNRFFQFSRETKGGAEYCVTKFSLATSADSVPADQIREHAELIENLRIACGRELTVHRGHHRSRERGDFGKLPLPERTAHQLTLAGMPTASAAAMPSAPPLLPPMRPSSSSRSRRRHHRRADQTNMPGWIIRIIIAISLLLFFLLSMISRH